MFEFGWQAFDAVADTARGLVGRRPAAAGAVSHGAQLALPVEVVPPAPSDELRSAAPDGLEGEFDDRIDPRFPVFGTNGLTEALPGPLTPITLDVQLSGLRTAGRVMGQALALGGVVDRRMGEQGHRGVRSPALCRGVGERRRRQPVTRLGRRGAVPSTPWSISRRSGMCCRLVSPGWPAERSGWSPRRSPRHDRWL